jgi:hypothetical protein
VTEQSMAGLIGHDEDARRRLVFLLDLYRREGLPAVRAWLSSGPGGELTLTQSDALVAEAVLTLAEWDAGAARRTAEDFDRAEAAVEGERERRR